MAGKGNFPGPYVGEVPAEGSEPCMNYIKSFDKLDIGANAAGMPSDLQSAGSLEHVGNSAGKGK